MHRLSGFDACLLSLETPSQHLTVAAAWELDTSTMPGGYSFAAFREKLSERLPALPELRMKLADSVLNLDTPVWVDDPTFDLAHHLHRVDLPAPGGRDELMEFAGQLMSEKMDRSKPLWDMFVIEGLSGDDPSFSGQVAVVHRFHHALVDGVTALDILSRLCSTEPDPPPPDARDGAGTVSMRQIVVDGLARFARRPWHLIATVLPAIVAAVANTVRRGRRGQSMPGILNTPRVPFNGNVSERRSLAYVQLNLEEVSAVKKRFGVTVNDVLLALVSATLRQFLLDRAALPSTSMIAAVPVSVHDPSRPSQNQLTFMLSSLYTDIADPRERLEAIATSSSVAKQHSSAMGPTLLQDLMHCAPGLLAFGMRIYKGSGLSARRPAFNLIVANAPGPQTQFYLMGATVRARYAFGTVFHGANLDITAMSLNGKLDIGLAACPDLLPDLWDLADGLPTALKELMDATVPPTNHD